MVVPKTLAENSGFDVQDSVIKLVDEHVVRCCVSFVGAVVFAVVFVVDGGGGVMLLLVLCD